MLRFVSRRLLQVIPTLLLLSLLVFAWLRSLPGGPASAFLGDRATPERIAELNRVLGLDQPVLVQYGRFLARVLTGDFGTSTITGEPVMAEIGRALPATIELSVAALLIAVLLGIPLGYLAAQHRGRPLDVTTVIGTLVGVAVPVFFLGYLLKAVFAVQLGWFPPSGRQAVDLDATNVTGFAVLDGLLTREWDASFDALGHLVLPAVALATIPLAVIVRITRASVLDVFGSDFVRTANSKGLAPGTVRSRHVLRNALLPILTLAGVQAGNLIGGSIVVETVFGWPGIGTLAFNALQSRDLNLLLAIFFMSACLIVIINLAVDVIYAVLDPRMEI